MFAQYDNRGSGRDKQPSIVGSTVYFNGLSEDSTTFCELYILCIDRRTGTEMLIDALLPDDRIATVLSAIKAALPADGRWNLVESWGIEEERPVMQPIAA